MQTISFVTINLHRCWPRVWKHSIFCGVWRFSVYLFLFWSSSSSFFCCFSLSNRLHWLPQSCLMFFVVPSCSRRHFARYIFDWRRESKERELLVCTRRHGGHVGGQEQKHFSPLGTKLYFHVNSSRKYSFVLTPNMAALSRGCKPRIRQAVFQPVSLTSSCLIKLETFNFLAKKTPVSDRLDLSPYLRLSRHMFLEPYA